MKITENNTIKTNDLVDYINEYREEKGIGKIRHDNMISKIKKIISTLNKTKIDINNMIIESSYKDKKNETRPCYELTKEGLKLLMDNTKTSDNIPMNEVYMTLGGEENQIYCIDRFENTFFAKLEDTLNAMGIELERQKLVFDGKYKIDGYIKEYNLAIEYDEEQHFREPNRTDDLARQQEITKKYRYKFIRLNYKDTDAYNIGLVINAIINKMIA